FDGPTRASTLDANDQLRSADAYRDLIIAYKNGSPLRIRDVASASSNCTSLTEARMVVVTFLFLRNVYATLIPSFAVPLSLIGTFGVMYLSGFSINNLTL
ncbi:efflux RND transporter permease subunit, partial [Pseudomonas aeruginosa]